LLAFVEIVVIERCEKTGIEFKSLKGQSGSHLNPLQKREAARYAKFFHVALGKNSDARYSWHCRMHSYHLSKTAQITLFLLLFSHVTLLSCQFALFIVLAESAFCDMLEIMPKLTRMRSSSWRCCVLAS
jgi:hypothetical protein